jgi:hypothetical protein
VVPFGLNNASVMSLMNSVFGKYLDKFVQVFLDDILITPNHTKNMRSLQTILQAIREQKLYTH